MPPLTTYARVYHRTGLTDKDVDSSDVEEFIEDAQAFIEGKTERTFAASDADYNLARAACTDLAAYYTLIRVLGGKYSGLQYYEGELDITTQQRSKLELAIRLLSQAKASLVIIEPKAPTFLRARSTTS